MAISHTSPEQVEVYRFSGISTVVIVAVALSLQTFLPRQLPFLSILDLPLLVTIFFGVARRNPVSGLFTGCIIGLIQDSLTSLPLGVYGIAKTVVGFAASSLGVKLDVENAFTRFLVTFIFYIIHEALYFTVAVGLVQKNMAWGWMHEFLGAVVNAVVGVLLFTFLDRFKHRI